MHKFADEAESSAADVIELAFWDYQESRRRIKTP